MFTRMFDANARKPSKPADDYEPVLVDSLDSENDLAYVGKEEPIETIYEGPATPSGVGMASRVRVSSHSFSMV